jgi:tRNA 2-selenouridine synthase
LKTWTTSVPMIGVEALLPPLGSVDECARGSAPTVIDLRSPAEFAEDHIPGAHNVPLFDDEGRAIVGLFYKQFSPDAAFQEARVLAVERIRSLVERIASLVGPALPAGWGDSADGLEKAVLEATSGGLQRLEQQLEGHRVGDLPSPCVVLHCWRGGLRSRSVVAFLRALGLESAVGLEGGYKSYRRHCMEQIAGWQAPRAFVLRGLTGVGKTLVLRALERLQPGWVMDLEAHAGHRSSLLGMVGLEPTTQKGFETRIFERMLAGYPQVVVFEGESRRVGDATVPESLWNAMQSAQNIELVASVERRVQVLLDDYLAEPAARPQLRAQLAVVEARMEKKVPLVSLFDGGDEPEVVRQLLKHYYDPLYRHSERGKQYGLMVDADDSERAAREIASWIQERISEFSSG